MAVPGTIALIDAESLTRLMRSIDESGTNSGPWSPVHALADRNANLIERDNPLSAFRTIKHSGSAFARPGNTTPYTSGDIITDAASGTSFSTAVPFVRPARAGAGFNVRMLRLKKTGAVVTNASFRVHLFKAAPTAIALDNAPFAATGNNNYLGVSSEGPMVSMGDGAQVTLTITLSHRFGAIEDSIYWLLEARAGYTPVSAENFELEMISEYD